jgi:hypothetical protein
MALKNVQDLFNSSEKLAASDDARAEYSQAMIHPSSMKFIYAKPEADVRTFVPIKSFAHHSYQTKQGAFESETILATLAHYLEATCNTAVTDFGYPCGALALVLTAVCLVLSYTGLQM